MSDLTSVFKCDILIEPSADSTLTIKHGGHNNNMPKKYFCQPEFIPNQDNEKLYELEQKMTDAIDRVVDWREKTRNEHYWQEALPQTILTILNGWDNHAVEVAVQCYLTKLPQEKIIPETEREATPVKWTGDKCKRV